MSDNIPEFTVTELSGRVKKTVEETFGYVRVRGELGRVNRHGSGHVYLDLKDDRAVLASVIWKGVASRLKVQPEQGMEVVATGRLTTFAGQSKYQMVVERLEPAGAGALMALFEERKKRLHAEGLFDPARKQDLPRLPGVIGVVTSPTGAVIRDILHRLRDRFPSHVIVWPTAVQGERAPVQLVAAIKGFNALDGSGPVARPDLMIVARGGGSLEDLWGFNDEAVARAVAESAIPVISAVGHETDTTLIDFVADRRAPTPTAAAEIAVPVRTELLEKTSSYSMRMISAMNRLAEQRTLSLRSAARGLGRPEGLVETATQRLDRASDRLISAMRVAATRSGARLDAARAGLRPARIHDLFQRAEDRLERADRLPLLAGRQLDHFHQRLEDMGRLLASYSYKGVLDRGFALVLDETGSVVRSGAALAPGDAVTLRFSDQDRTATIDGGSPSKKKPSRQKADPAATQSTLFD
ncbi:MAG: exodeoxyribonuclease VII large subunit [Parvularcula sp.]